MEANRLFVDLERNEPGRGQLLIAAPGKEEMARSVILIMEHNEFVTVGVDLTTRSDVAVFNVLPEWLPAVAKPQALYIGGPRNQQSVLGLAMTAPGVDIEAEEHLTKLAPRLAHVDLRIDPEALKPLVSGLRLFAGYVDWKQGQLEEEIAAGDWFVAPALPQDVIARGDLWADVMKRQPQPLPLYATFPADPSEN